MLYFFIITPFPIFPGNQINNEYHQGTGEIPILMFPKEKHLLSSLPRKQIRDAYKINHTLVKINSSNMLSYKSNQYSVPSGFIGKRVSLQIYDKSYTRLLLHGFNCTP